MLLEVNDICKTFPGHERPVLEHVTFSVGEGERVGIVGDSGSGKSTLARIIADLEPADSGSVSFNGSKVDCGKPEGRGPFSKSGRRRAAWRDMQMVFQDPLASFSNRMDVGDAVWEGAAYKPEFSGRSRSERTRVVRDALESVGLDGSFAKRRPFELSGGECQRAAIARAVIGNPRLIICDEATSALDVTVQAHVMNLLERLHRERGMAFIFISHNAALVQGFCERVYSVHSTRTYSESIDL